MPEKKTAKRRTYKGEIPASKGIEVGDIISGVLVGMKNVSLTDQNTHELKEVRSYVFRDSSGVKFTLLGRTGLDFAFDEILEKEGGLEKIIGCNVEIRRGKDTRLKGGRTYGNYEVDIWEE